MNTTVKPEAEMVTITKAEYEALLEASRQLAALDDAGVDNWEGNQYRYKNEEDEDE